ncbi:hypothetical protein HA402_007936 [Bradysia odoriphaga]|nr:hypothetical protein HA402_007936 [Bradysia odoriphaga]
MIDEPNGNNLLMPKHPNGLASSFSNDDMSQSQSQSISEYTDANESMSCPTEFLAEFLSAVMLKDYKKALKYCKLILEFEPNNITAKEFYPLIQEKLKYMSTSSTTDNLNQTSSQDLGEPEESEASHDSSSDQSDTDYSIESDDDKEPNDGGEYMPNHSNTSSNCTSGSENTTHSYPSSLLEEEDDLHLMPNLEKLNLSPSLSDLNNGNYEKASTSESESPTEPLTQHIAANIG